MKLDRTDFEIVNHLQNNARISNKDLAAQCDISPSTCLERVRRLQSAGVIRGYHADVDPAAMAIAVQAMIAVRLNQHGEVTFGNLRDDLLQVPEVMAVYLIAGENDYLVHVAVKDVIHLRNLVGETLMNHRDIAHLETWLIFEHARKPQLPNYLDSP